MYFQDMNTSKNENGDISQQSQTVNFTKILNTV